MPVVLSTDHSLCILGPGLRGPREQSCAAPALPVFLSPPSVFPSPPLPRRALQSSLLDLRFPVLPAPTRAGWPFLLLQLLTGLSQRSRFLSTAMKDPSSCIDLFNFNLPPHSSHKRGPCSQTANLPCAVFLCCLGSCLPCPPLRTRTSALSLKKQVGHPPPPPYTHSHAFSPPTPKPVISASYLQGNLLSILVVSGSYLRLILSLRSGFIFLLVRRSWCLG